MTLPTFGKNVKDAEKTALSMLEELKSPELREQMEESYRTFGRPSPEDWQRRFTI